MGVFSENAPAYWAAGMPVMPCSGKRPIINGWPQYGLRMPTADEQADWLTRYPDANIGLPLGPQSGLCVVDIDTDNPEAIAAIKTMLPPSTVERIGKKGCALFYKWEGQKNFSVGGDHPVDFLSQGKQVIIPPSIHPDTGKAYYFKGAGLC